MLIAKEELAIEVAQVNGIEVDNVYVAKAGEDEVLEELAANTAGAHHEHSRLPCCQLRRRRVRRTRESSRTCLMRACRLPPRL